MKKTQRNNIKGNRAFDWSYLFNSLVYGVFDIPRIKPDCYGNKAANRSSSNWIEKDIVEKSNNTST